LPKNQKDVHPLLQGNLVFGVNDAGATSAALASDADIAKAIKKISINRGSTEEVASKELLMATARTAGMIAVRRAAGKINGILGDYDDLSKEEVKELFTGTRDRSESAMLFWAEASRATPENKMGSRVSKIIFPHFMTKTHTMPETYSPKSYFNDFSFANEENRSGNYKIAAELRKAAKEAADKEKKE
jgi:hypothetical protein